VTLKRSYYHAYANGFPIFAAGLDVVTLVACPTNNISFKGGGGGVDGGINVWSLKPECLRPMD
jgi:uncharacterized membrane protein